MSGTRDVGKNITTIHSKHPSWSHARVLALALSQARSAGAKIPAPPKTSKPAKRRKKRR